MSRFSDCFFLIFGQLAVGGAWGLAVPPFRVIDRGFYRSSAGIFAASAVLFVAVDAVLVWQGHTFRGRHGIELALWALFAACFVGYTASLWGEDAPRRARAFTGTLASGLLALAVTATGYPPADFGPALRLLAPLPFVTSALSLGAVATGMLLGHWYLIDLGLSIEPLARVLRYFLSVTLLHLVVLLLVLALAWASGGEAAGMVRALLGSYRFLLLGRLLLGPVAALLVGLLVHRTLAIPQTMAATGLFYVAILFVMVGEMLGLLILSRTGLPL